jgi:tRNA pseudouridine38-40 synthase
MRAKATIEYMGAAYAGWQAQPDQRTVQSAIENALATVVGERVAVQSAGRTDAGVHALGQVAAFDLPDGTDLYRLRASINGLTPDDVSLVLIEEVAADFDARRHAKSRTYEYTMVSGRPRAPMLEGRCWFMYQELDLDTLNRAAACIVGTHDFSAFRAADCNSDSTVRNVFESGWSVENHVYRYRIRGNAFLKHMVRILVGSMVDIQLERLEFDTFRELLNGGDRDDAGRTAAAEGLVLLRVDY